MYGKAAEEKLDHEGKQQIKKIYAECRLGFEKRVCKNNRFENVRKRLAYGRTRSVPLNEALVQKTKNYQPFFYNFSLFF